MSELLKQSTAALFALLFAANAASAETKLKVWLPVENWKATFGFMNKI